MMQVQCTVVQCEGSSRSLNCKPDVERPVLDRAVYGIITCSTNGITILLRINTVWILGWPRPMTAEYFRTL